MGRRNQKIVYKVTNTTNNKSYIGWCIDFTERKNRHLNEVKKGTGTHFYNAIRKYGHDVFTWEILRDDFSTYDECKEYEKRMIKEYDTYYCGYNSTKGGDGGNTFSKLTDDNKLKFKKLCSINNARVWKNKKFTKEHIEKLKKADRSKQYIPVNQLNKDGVLIKKWGSAKEASDKLKISNHIHSVCKGKRKTCGGFIWEYETKNKLL